MLREVMHEDPLSPEAMERQSRFMRKIVRLLVLDARSGASRNDRTRADE
jgi:hypothetical protein